MVNKNIKCDVISCAHNEQGSNCGLATIHVGCGCGDQSTCCDSFDVK